MANERVEKLNSAAYSMVASEAQLASVPNTSTLTTCTTPYLTPEQKLLRVELTQTPLVEITFDEPIVPSSYNGLIRSMFYVVPEKPPVGHTDTESAETYVKSFDLSQHTCILEEDCTCGIDKVTCVMSKHITRHGSWHQAKMGVCIRRYPDNPRYLQP